MQHLVPILVVLAGYAATLVGIGLAFAKYAASTKAVYRADNLVPWWIAGLSQFMASHSAYMFVVVGGVLYTRGSFGFLWFILMYPVTLFLVALCFARRWHRTGVSTPVEYLEVRFGPGVRQAFAWLGLIFRPFSNGVRMAAFGVVMAAIMGFDEHARVWPGLTPPGAIAVAGLALVVTYTLLGGLMGALVADAVQFVIFETALLALFGLSWRRAGGLGPLLANFPLHESLPPLRDPAWIWLLGWMLLQFADTSAAQWGLITRFLCTRSDRDALKAGCLTAGLYLPLLALVAVPVFVARSLHPGVNPEASFGWISRALLPPGLLALMIAALFSATLATLSAELNTLSGVLTLDVFKRRWRPEATERETVRFGRWAVGLLGIEIGIIALVVVGGASTILRATQEISSLIVVPMCVPLVGGMFSSRSSGGGVYASVLLGIGISAAARALGHALSWPDTRLILVQNGSAAVVSIAALWAGGRRFPLPPEGLARAAEFIARMRVPDRARPDAATGFPAPLPLVGRGVLAIAATVACTLAFGNWDLWTAGGAGALGLMGWGLIRLGRPARPGSPS